MDGQNNFYSLKKEHQPIIEDHNYCCLCGTKLDFKHRVDFMTLKVQEEADCPSCRIRMKNKEHVLQ